jgi:hypothetical protein
MRVVELSGAEFGSMTVDEASGDPMGLQDLFVASSLDGDCEQDSCERKSCSGNDRHRYYYPYRPHPSLLDASRLVDVQQPETWWRKRVWRTLFAPACRRAWLECGKLPSLVARNGDSERNAREDTFSEARGLYEGQPGPW